MEKLYAKFELDPTDALGHVGLGGVEIVCGATNASSVRDGKEEAECAAKTH